MRVPIGAALALALVGAGCSSGDASKQNGQRDLVEADVETVPADNAAAVVPTVVAAPKPAVKAASSNSARRCGWLHNPTPGNWWLTDAQGQWILATQGADQAPGMDEMPDMSTAGWVETNGHYGHGCACMTITANPDGRVTRVADASPRPIKQCQGDRKLPKPE